MPLAVVIGLRSLPQGGRIYEAIFEITLNCSEGVLRLAANLSGFDSPSGDGHMEDFNAAYMDSDCNSSEPMRISVRVILGRMKR